jgi:hypothetical protein
MKTNSVDQAAEVPRPSALFIFCRTVISRELFNH